MTHKLLSVLVVTLTVLVHSYVFAKEDQPMIYFKSEKINTSVAPQKAILSSDVLSNKPTYVVLQFRGPVKKKYKAELETLGVEFLNYIPQHAYVVRLKEKMVPRLYQFKMVQWVGDYKPQFKISPELVNIDAQSDEKKIKLTIRLFQGESLESVSSYLVRLPADLLYKKGNIIQAEVARKHISDISFRQEVAWIEEAKEAKIVGSDDDEDDGDIDDPVGEEPEDEVGNGRYEDLTGFESGVALLNPDIVYEEGVTGKGQIVAIGDTGLDIGEISDNLSLDFRGRVLAGYAMGFFAEGWKDRMGHGTHVAGSVLGSGEYSEGRLAGVAYEAELLVQGLAGAFGGLNVPPNLEDLFGPVYEEGARVHSNSWGMRARGGYDQASKSLDEFVWNNPDMVVVMAAGNSGEDADKNGMIDPKSLLSPAIAKNCITVGASENLVEVGGIQKSWGELRGGDQKWGVEPIKSDTPSDHEDGIAAFSSRGPTEDGRMKPDLVAPGTNVLSARSHHPDASTLWGAFNEHYAWSGGTSMATPLVSGSATLVRQFYQDFFELERMSAALIKATLINGADDLYPGQFGFGDIQEMENVRPNIHQGWGRVNLERSMFPEYRSIRFSDETVGLATEETKEYRFRVSDDLEPLVVTLVYSDFPGSTQADLALVNDLDVEVFSPSGEKFTPNGLEGPDRFNNVESIDIVEPEVGTYTVKVSGYNVPEGNDEGAQPYALVVSGGIN